MPWVPVSAHLIFPSPPIHFTPISTSLLLGLKVWATITWLSFFFKLLQPCGIVLKYFCLCLLSAGIKGVCRSPPGSCFIIQASSPYLFVGKFQPLIFKIFSYYWKMYVDAYHLIDTYCVCVYARMHARVSWFDFLLKFSFAYFFLCILLCMFIFLLSWKYSFQDPL